MTQNIPRILFLADQPWQASIQLALAKKMAREIKFEGSILFTDYYTFIFDKAYLRGIMDGFSGNVYTQEKLYKSWQENTENPSTEQPRGAHYKYSNGRSLQTIKKMNQWIYGNERSQYYKKISKEWEDKIFLDTLRWTEEIIGEVDPNIIISLERSTVPNNLIYEIALEKEIKFLTLISSRFESRWIVREDFGIGMSSEQYQHILENYQLNNSDFQSHVNGFSGEGSYQSVSHEIQKNFQRQQDNRFRNWMRECRILIGKIYSRTFLRPRDLNFKIIRLREDLFKLTMLEIRKSIIMLFRSLGLKIWGKTKVPSEKFILWCLHMRPEGSVLVLGDAADEIEILLDFVKVLPAGIKIAVKENPEMFGIREFGFYKRLKSNKNIILIDPFTATVELINASLGVVGISGTVLFEAALLGKPTLALGKPEFLPFLSHSGVHETPNFFKYLETSNKELVRRKIEPYLRYIQVEGTSPSFRVGQTYSEESRDKLVQELSDIIFSKIVPRI